MKKEKIEKGKNLSLKFKIAVIALTLFFLWILIAPFLATNLITEKPLEKADAIMVLGGASTYLERAQKAAELYKKGIAPKILLTNDGGQGGWNIAEQRNPFFYENARWELIAQGVPAENIEVLPEIVQGTNDEAMLLEKAAWLKNLNKVLLVTSAYHTRRALWEFERVFERQSHLIELGITSPPTGEQTIFKNLWWLSADGWKFVGGEYVKFLGYWLFY